MSIGWVRVNDQYPIRIPDESYYFDLISCMAACPVNTYAGGYVQAIGRGDLRRSFSLAAGPNPLASVCGRVCAHPCEKACRRGNLDQPISIRALKRVATEQFGAERSFPDLREQLPSVHFGLDHAPLPVRSGGGRKVAVVGAGPAGLACAHDLTRMGYGVSVFDAAALAGGMMALGIPEYRLPRDILRAEINRILDLGVTLHTEQKLGVHFKIRTLFSEGYEAIFLGIGTGCVRELKIPGVDLDGVMHGIDFLLNVNLGYRMDLGQRIAVVGGGNVAMDVARTALRVGTPENGATMLDAARTARRLGARQVMAFSLETREELPADPEELEEAMVEGIEFHYSRGIKEIVGREGKAAFVVTQVCERTFDEQGRFNPVFRQGDEQQWEVDGVLLAVGQMPDPDVLGGEPDLETTASGLIRVDEQSLATSIPGVYAGGDVAFGPRILISAVADGKRAARSIHRYLSGASAPLRTSRFVRARMERHVAGYDMVPRQTPPTLPTSRRTGFSEVEQVYDPETGRLEADRCLWCHVSPVFDSALCILCGGCVEICPERCLAIVPTERLSSKQSLRPLLEAREADRYGAAIIKDETLCIRCGLCARRCPTGAITMEQVIYEDK